MHVSLLSKQDLQNRLNIAPDQHHYLLLYISRAPGKPNSWRSSAPSSPAPSYRPSSLTWMVSPVIFPFQNLSKSYSDVTFPAILSTAPPKASFPSTPGASFYDHFYYTRMCCAFCPPRAYRILGDKNHTFGFPYICCLAYSKKSDVLTPFLKLLVHFLIVGGNRLYSNFYDSHLSTSSNPKLRAKKWIRVHHCLQKSQTYLVSIQ